MPSVCSNASWKTWTPLPDRFIDEHLVKMFPLFDQAWLQLVNVMNLAAIQRSCSFPQIWLAGKFCDEFFAPYPFSCLRTIIKTRSSAENTMFIVYASCLQVTSDCSKQRCIGNRDILSSVSNNTFSWNLVVLSQIYSKTSAHNFIKIYSDLTFLSHIV